MKPSTIDRDQHVPLAIPNMRSSCALPLPWFVGRSQHDDVFVIVGGGPSMASRVDAIKLRQRKGEIIVALNGANGFLRGRGVTPDLVVFVDPSAVVAGFVTDAKHDKATYLVASICHPDVFAALAGRDVCVWHPEIPGKQGVEQREILSGYGNLPVVLVGGGCTGALRSLSLGFIMGFRRFHMYGVDSSYSPGGKDHAYEKHDGIEPDALMVAFDGDVYHCSPWMIRQADEFRFYYQQMAAAGASVTVHGDGLIPDIATLLNKVRRLHTPFHFQMPMSIN